MSVEPVGRSPSVPLSFDHLRRLSDDTGLLEHALGRVPRRREGYTTDDNARALWLVTEWLSLRDAAGLSRADVRLLGELADIYLAFLLWNLEEDGWWHNNVAYDRTWEPEERSHDCQGRAFWACADAWIRLPTRERVTAYYMLQRVLPTLDAIASLRGQGYALAACAHLLEAGRTGVIELPDSWEAPLRRHLVRLERSLLNAYRQEASPGWCWFEPVMTYGNGLLPWALLRAHRVTRNPEALEVGLRSLQFLLGIMTAPEGWIRPVGNASWATRDSFSRWDQQPLELFKLALALDEAILALRRLEGGGDAAGLVLANGVPASGGIADSGAGNLDRRDEWLYQPGKLRKSYRGDQTGEGDLHDRGQGVNGNALGATDSSPTVAATEAIGGNSGTGARDGGTKPGSGSSEFSPGLSSGRSPRVSDLLSGLTSDLSSGPASDPSPGPASDSSSGLLSGLSSGSTSGSGGVALGDLLLAGTLPALSLRRRPAEIRPLPSALAELREAKLRCLQWFHGHNDLGVPMADPWDGSCCDGLQPDGPNRNCGAEATLSYLMTRALCLKDERLPLSPGR